MRIQGINMDCRMMRAISSHRDHRGSKMRFLVVSAFLACAAAAPSHLLAPVAVPAPVVPVARVAAVPVTYSAAIPTLSPGDVQAAAIDAQVKAQDLAIAAIDRTREINEQAAENLKEATEGMKDQVVVKSDAVKENNEEAFWAVQDKQWQALDALKTAEAQLDGALASDAPALAKSVVTGIAPLSPYVAGVAPVSPYLAGIAPVAPIVYNPGFLSPVVKTVEAVKLEEAKPNEDAKQEKNEASVKSTEEKNEEKNSVVIEALTKNLEAKPQLPVITPLAIQPYYNQGYPIVAPVNPLALAPSVLSYGAYPQVGLAPTIVKSAW